MPIARCAAADVCWLATESLPALHTPALHAEQGQQEAPETVERVQAASDAGCGCGCGVGVGAEGGSQDPRAAAVVARRCVRRAYGRGAGVTPGVHLRL